MTLLIEEELTPALSGGAFVLLCNGRVLGAADFAVVRAQNYILSHHLELMGMRVFNSSRVSRVCGDKMLTYQLALSLNLPVMDTIFVKKNSPFPMSPFFPCVLKPIDGKGGEKVFLARDPSEYEKLLPHFAGRDMLIQKCASRVGRDTRVYVMGKRILCSFTRVSDTDFRSNFCLGGRAVPHTLSAEEHIAVQKLCDALEPDFVGVDFVYDFERAVFNEVEDVVGSRMVYANTDINVAGEYIDYILSEM